MIHCEKMKLKHCSNGMPNWLRYYWLHQLKIGDGLPGCVSENIVASISALEARKNLPKRL